VGLKLSIALDEVQREGNESNQGACKKVLEKKIIQQVGTNL